MSDTKPQTADGKVLFHFAMSLDGFVAGPDHEMDWMTGVSVRPGLHDEYVKTTGAILGGRNGWDQAIDGSRPYGGAWQGPIFVLTHHPEDAAPADDVTFLTCGPAEAVRIGLAAAGGKNLEVFSPTVGRQLLELGLIDEIDLHIVPVLLGDGIRLYDNPGGKPVRLHRAGESDPMAAVNVRYRPATLWTAGEWSMSTALSCAWTLPATRLISTSPAVPFGPGRAELPPMSEDPRAYFAAEVPRPDWAERTAVIDYLAGYERRLEAAEYFDEAHARAGGADHRPHQRHGRQRDEPRRGRGGRAGPRAA